MKVASLHRREHLLCPDCVAEGKVYSEVEQVGDAGVVEISGRGTICPTPVRTPAEEIPRRADGTFDADELMAFIEAGRRRCVEDMGIQTTGGFHHSQSCFGRRLPAQEQ